MGRESIETDRLREKLKELPKRGGDEKKKWLKK